MGGGADDDGQDCSGVSSVSTSSCSAVSNGSSSSPSSDGSSPDELSSELSSPPCAGGVACLPNRDTGADSGDDGGGDCTLTFFKGFAFGSCGAAEGAGPGASGAAGATRSSNTAAAGSASAAADKGNDDARADDEDSVAFLRNGLLDASSAMAAG